MSACGGASQGGDDGGTPSFGRDATPDVGAFADAVAPPADAELLDASGDAELLDASGAIDAAVPDSTASATDATLTDAGSADAGGGDVLTECEPVISGSTPLPTGDPPPNGVVGPARVYDAFANAAGLYWSFTSRGFKNPDVHGIHFLPAGSDTVGTVVVPEPIYNFVVAGGYAYQQLSGAVARVDLATGEPAPVNLTLSPLDSQTLHGTPTHLYWVDEPTAGDFVVVRAPVLADGAIGARETLTSAPDGLDFAWSDDVSLMIWPSGTASPTPFGVPNPPEMLRSFAFTGDAGFLALNGYTPSTDGGCAGSLCTSYPGELLGADVFRRDHATGRVETVYSSAGEVFPIVTTTLHVFFIETISMDQGSCGHLWRTLPDGSELTLLLRSESLHMSDPLVSYADVAYLLDDEIYRFD